MMAVTYGKDKNIKAIADALSKRYGGTMNGANPGGKPAPTGKLVVKPKKDSIYVGGKLTF